MQKQIALYTLLATFALTLSPCYASGRVHAARHKHHHSQAAAVTSDQVYAQMSKLFGKHFDTVSYFDGSNAARPCSGKIAMLNLLASNQESANTYANEGVSILFDEYPEVQRVLVSVDNYDGTDTFVSIEEDRGQKPEYL